MMEDKRFVLYDLELFIRRRWYVLFFAAALIAAAVYACTQPFVSDYSRTFSGYELRFDDDTEFASPTASPASIRLDGKMHRYLFKPDYFEGELVIDGFDLVQEEWMIEYAKKWYGGNTPIRLESDGKVTIQHFSTGLSGEYTRGEETIDLAWASFKRNQEFFGFWIFDTSTTLPYGDFTCIITPAQSEQEALNLFHQHLLPDLKAMWDITE